MKALKAPLVGNVALHSADSPVYIPQFFLQMSSRLLSKFPNSLVNEDYKSHLCNNNIILNAAFVVSLVLISFPFAISVVRHQKAPVQ